MFTGFYFFFYGINFNNIEDKFNVVPKEKNQISSGVVVENNKGFIKV